MKCEHGKYNVFMIYYVEDDTNIRELALYALRQASLDAEGFVSAEPFRAACAVRLPDLILLDIMLPGTDGLALLSELRSDPATAAIPVMMLTAKGTEYDTVLGLDMGADDYLAKPFGMMELVSRCKALLRRCEARSAPVEPLLACGEIRLRPDAHEAWVSDAPLALTLKEYELLRKLMEEQGHALTRPQLLEDVWGISFVGETRTVDTHVQTLRKKLNEAHEGAGDCIQTIRGVGYRMRRDG